MTSGVRVRAAARLHMGFLDLNGSLGRRFGSVGLALEEIAVELHASAADALQVRGPQATRARTLADAFLGPGAGASIHIREAIPEHVGLGSGTQLALAVGTALGVLHGRGPRVRDVATLHARGQRSGIGVGVFEQGGFVVDGGRGQADSPPPVIVRMDFPEPWRVILIQDETCHGLHGPDEIRAFQALPPMSEAHCGQLCRLLLMQILPALAEENLEAFGRGITLLQSIIGDHFAPAQGGRFTSGRVASALESLERRGATGVGQSSWGPTGFAFVPDEDAGQRLLRDIRLEGLSLRLLKGRNRGADVEVVSDSAHAVYSDTEPRVARAGAAS